MKSLHWLTVSERFEYKIISLTYQILNTTQPPYLYDLVSIQPPHGHNTRSSPYVTLIKPSSSLKVTHLSFRHAAPHLWNQLPTSLEFLIQIIHPLSATFIWTYKLNLQHTAITFYHLFTVSFWTRNLLFQNILSSTCSVIVCFCLSDWSHGLPDLFSHRFYGLLLFISDFS